MTAFEATEQATPAPRSAAVFDIAAAAAAAAAFSSSLHSMAGGITACAELHVFPSAV